MIRYSIIHENKNKRSSYYNIANQCKQGKTLQVKSKFAIEIFKDLLVVFHIIYGNLDWV
jgi:hypothetical protein